MGRMRDGEQPLFCSEIRGEERKNLQKLSERARYSSGKLLVASSDACATRGLRLRRSPLDHSVLAFFPADFVISKHLVYAKSTRLFVLGFCRLC